MWEYFLQFDRKMWEYIFYWNLVNLERICCTFVPFCVYSAIFCALHSSVINISYLIKFCVLSPSKKCVSVFVLFFCFLLIEIIKLIKRWIWHYLCMTLCVFIIHIDDCIWTGKEKKKRLSYYADILLISIRRHESSRLLF